VAEAQQASIAVLQRDQEATRAALASRSQELKTVEQLAASYKAAYTASQQELQATQAVLASCTQQVNRAHKALKAQQQRATAAEAAAQKDLAAAQQRIQDLSQAAARGLVAASISSFEAARLRSKIDTLQQLLSKNQAGSVLNNSSEQQQDCSDWYKEDWCQHSSLTGSLKQLARTTGSSGSTDSLMSASSGLQLSCSSVGSMSSRLGSNLSASWPAEVLEGRTTAACSTEGCSRSSSFSGVCTCSCALAG
jgi:chromosome segregation ATPase